MKSESENRSRSIRWPRWTARGIVAGLAGLVAGCPGAGLTMGNDVLLTDGNQDTSLMSPLGKTSNEPNDTFFDPIVAVFDAERIARLQGSVEVIGDLDVFRIGALSPGDRVVVDVDTGTSPLDVSVAIFDAAQRLVSNNDDRGGEPNRFLDSYIDWTVRHASDPYYLVVSNSAFANVGRRTGTYRIDLRVTTGSEAPPPARQVLLLNFDGGEVDSPVLGTMTLEPLDASDISTVYRGQTELLKESILEVMEQNLERFDVLVLTTEDAPPPAGTPFSTIYFGGFDRFSFGISENVDLNNVDLCDDALVFAESFDPGVFSFTPTLEELALAIGNVAAHEAGHLLGLNHVSNDLALMDDQSAADAFIEDQEFMEAPLSSDIMAIGTQDAVLLLNENVGPAGGLAPKRGGFAFARRRPE